VQRAVADTDVLYEFYREGEATEAEIQAEYDATQAKVEALEFKRMLSDEEDQLPAIIDINPGAGGTESQDWLRCSCACTSCGASARASPCGS